MTDSNMQIEHFTTSSAIEIAQDLGLDIERFNSDEIERIAAISNSVIDLYSKQQLDEKGARGKLATFVTTFAVAEQFPQLVQGTESLVDLENIDTENLELLNILRDLHDLGVTDIEDFVPGVNDSQFSETDDLTAELVTSLSAVRDQIIEYQDSTDVYNETEVDHGYDELEVDEIFEDEDEDENDTSEVATVIIDNIEVDF